MSQVLVVYGAAPSFPATDQHPSAVRYQVGGVWVDAIGGAPSQAEVDAVRLPPVVYTANIPLSGHVRTTDATVTEVFRATLAQLTAYAAQMQLIGIDAGNGVMLRLRADVTAERLNGGAVLIGTDVLTNRRSTGAAATTSSVSTWTATASVSGNDFVITVQGAAGRTVDWTLGGSALTFTPGGVP